MSRILKMISTLMMLSTSYRALIPRRNKAPMKKNQVKKNSRAAKPPEQVRITQTLAPLKHQS